MKLRAKQATQITGPKGVQFVEGPDITETGVQIDGQIVDVPDGYVVNPDVWEVVRVAPDGRTVVLEHPVDGVRYVGDDMRAKQAKVGAGGR